jgi:hypothetical protein
MSLLCKIAILCILFFITFPQTAQAQRQSNNYQRAAIVLAQERDQPVSLVGFPEVRTRFSVLLPDGHYVKSMDGAELLLFEDNYRIQQYSLSAPQKESITSIVVFDIDPKLEDIAGFRMQSLEAFRELVGEAGRQSVDGDAWVFCSTKLEELCLEPAWGQLEQQLVPIHNQLSRPFDTDTALPTVLRQSMAKSRNLPQQKVIIIVKLRPYIGETGEPYIPDGLITDLLITRTPIALVNLTEANDRDYPNFLTDTKARIEQINGRYFHNDYVEQRLGEFVEEVRPVSFELSYNSRLFRDNDTHMLVLGYENDLVSAWISSEFYFPSPDYDANMVTYSSLRREIVHADSLLSFTLILILIILVVLSENDRPVEFKGGNAITR